MTRPGGERRGNVHDRRARKLWMLATWGDGTSCPCVWCGRGLDYGSVEADRVEAGGSYRRSNVQPSCGPCNKRRGSRPVGMTLRTC